jgi:hypothetical protein
VAFKAGERWFAGPILDEIRLGPPSTHGGGKPNPPPPLPT